MTGSYTDKKAELDRELTKLAYRTEAWAIQLGCYREGKDRQVANFFIIEPTCESDTGKPCWSEKFGEASHTWPEVEDRMLSLNMALVFVAFKGFFIGDPGEQGKTVANNINHIFTRMQTTYKRVDFMMLDSQWGLIEPHLKAGLAKELTNVELRELSDSLRQFLLTAGPVQHGIGELLLAEPMSK